MKIKEIKYSNYRKAFEVITKDRSYFFPYAAAEAIPTKENPIQEIYVDKEIGNEGFSYVLKSGEEETIHIEQVLDYNKDPEYLKNMLLYQLTLKAQERIEQSELSKREISRILRTSPTQLYRLLDQTNYKKSVGQMLALLEILNCEVEFVIKERDIKTA